MEEQIQAIVELIIAGGDELDKAELQVIADRIERRIQREGIRW